MNLNLKCKLTMLPLLAVSTWASANPVLLSASSMDRITAGTQVGLEGIANMLASVHNVAGNFSHLGELLPWLGAEQLTWLTKLANVEPVTVHISQSGELVVTRQSQSGEQIVLTKQLDAAAAASIHQTSPTESVKTYTLGSGESLHVQQTNGGGANYLYVYSNGNSAVTTWQKYGM